MTHSLKVAQLGRRFAQYLQTLSESKDNFAPDPDLVEAACLAHDLGHPPFGHAGEQALLEAADELILQREGKEDDSEDTSKKIIRDFGGFEGNAQTLRILVRLSTRDKIVSEGLDLTRAVLDATIKYPWCRQDGGFGALKWNVYQDDVEYAEWIRGGDHLGIDEEKSVEAKLMDWCDDVAYACHDLQDFYRAGIIPLDQIFQFTGTKSGGVFNPTPSAVAAEAARAIVVSLEKKKKKYDYDEVVKIMYDLSDLVKVYAKYDGGRDAKATMHQTTSALITRYMKAMTIGTGIAARYQGKLEIDPSSEREVEVLKELIWIFVIDQPALHSQQIGQQRIVKDLLQIFYDNENDPKSLLPLDRIDDWQHRQGNYLRCCIDHVASMTDSGAVALHQRLTGTHIGSHSDASWRI